MSLFVLRTLGQFSVLNLAILSTLRIFRVLYLLPLILTYEAFFISILDVIRILSYQAMERTYLKPCGAPILDGEVSGNLRDQHQKRGNIIADKESS